MGQVNAQLVLKNLDDVKRVNRGELPESKVRQTAVTAIVDTGATTLVINKALFQELGLDAMGERRVTFANDTKEICKLTEPVGIYWNDRFVAMYAFVVEDAAEVLLGVLPLEGMDLMVDPVNQKLVGVHGDQMMFDVKSAKIYS
ncbi:MAG: retroviral-like aspartic protease family protein [Treponema sp.]|jgi:clan AA aspartic protease|nr:retroviral-like aspartic protease family protein [Treponema sp.]